jgi:predicted nucleotidyltransferase
LKLINVVRAFLKRIDGAEGCIMYGAAVSGKLDRRSDIDVLLLAPKPLDEQQLSAAVIKTSEETGWRVHPEVVTYDQLPRERTLLAEVFSSGKPVALRGAARLFDRRIYGLEPWVLYSLRLPKRGKNSVAHRLYGRRFIKRYKGKEYPFVSKGIVGTFGGKRVGRGAVLIPSDNAHEFEAAGKKLGIRIKRIGAVLGYKYK